MLPDDGRDAFDRKHERNMQNSCKTALSTREKQAARPEDLLSHYYARENQKFACIAQFACCFCLGVLFRCQIDLILIARCSAVLAGCFV